MWKRFRERVEKGDSLAGYLLQWPLVKELLEMPGGQALGVLAARADQRNQVTNWVQTAGILVVFVGSLITSWRADWREELMERCEDVSN